MDEDNHWGAAAVDPRERSLPGLKAAFLVEHAPRTGRVLEIGSGDGKMLRTLHRHRAAIELVGCDVRTPGTPPDCYEFRKIEGPLPEEWAGTFDAVLIMDVLEHVPDPAALLHDAARVLRPGGSLVAFVPIEGEPISAYSLFRKLAGDDVYVATKEHVQAFRHRELEELVARDFAIEERRYAYHAVGQSMDAGFFAAQRFGRLRDAWRRDNAFYNEDKRDAGGAAGLFNALLRAGNALAWAESRALASVRRTSAGVLLRARRRDERKS